MALLFSCNGQTSEDISQYLNLGTGKGLEVYCFQENGEWKMGLMSGTNRNKYTEEVDALEGISLESMKKVLATYENYRDYTRVIGVSRPSKWQETRGIPHIDNIVGLNFIEMAFGQAPTKNVGLYSLLDWVEIVFDKEVVAGYYQTDLGSISPTFTSREATYVAPDSNSLSLFVASLGYASVYPEANDLTYGGSGIIYRVSYDDGTSDSLQILNGDVIVGGYGYTLASTITLRDAVLYSENFVHSVAYGGTLYKDGVKTTIDTGFAGNLEFVYEDEQVMDASYEGYELRLEDDEYLTFYDEDSFAIHSPYEETTFHKVINGISFPFPS